TAATPAPVRTREASSPWPTPAGHGSSRRYTSSSATSGRSLVRRGAGRGAGARENMGVILSGSEGCAFPAVRRLLSASIARPSKPVTGDNPEDRDPFVVGREIARPTT